MRFTTIRHDDTSVTDIANRLFCKSTKDSLKTAEEAIIRLNPELLQENVLKAGVIIKVPERLGLHLNENEISADPAAETKATIKKAIESYGNHLTQRAEAQQEDLNSQHQLLMKVKDIVESDKDSLSDTKNLISTIEALGKSIDARIAESKGLEGDFHNWFEQISNALSQR